MNSLSSTAASVSAIREIEQLDLSKIQHKMRHVCAKKGHPDDAEAIAAQLTSYRHFLQLIALHPDAIIVPTEEIDEVWHQHILDTERYQPDCVRIFGYPIHHYPYFGIHDAVDQANLQIAYAETASLYRRHFTDGAYDGSAATRCSGHACHVPSACRCRTPSACKKVTT